jgi:hypothetical protein
MRPAIVIAAFSQCLIFAIDHCEHARIFPEVIVFSWKPYWSISDRQFVQRQGLWPNSTRKNRSKQSPRDRSRPELLWFRHHNIESICRLSLDSFVGRVRSYSLMSLPDPYGRVKVHHIRDPRHVGDAPVSSGENSRVHLSQAPYCSPSFH